MRMEEGSERIYTLVCARQRGSHRATRRVSGVCVRRISIHRKLRPSRHIAPPPPSQSYVEDRQRSHDLLLHALVADDPILELDERSERDFITGLRPRDRP